MAAADRPGHGHRIPAGTWAMGRVREPEGVSEVQILGLWRQEQVDPAALVAVKEVSRPLEPTLPD